MKKILQYLLAITFCLISPIYVYCTHLRAADIIIEKADCFSLTYKITIKIYTNTQSGTPVGGSFPQDGSVSFGDGTTFIIPESPVTPRPDLGANIGIVIIQVTHTYTQEGTYKVNYFERDRSEGILNISQSADVAYSTYVLLKATGQSCNTFPQLSVPPVDRACKGVAFSHNPGATDNDGDSLSYAITTPSKSADQFVDGFIQPNDARFYTNFNTGNEAGTGPPQFAIDAETGLLTWDAPGMQGEYNVAIKIIEWRKDPVTGLFSVISETIRDMQIVVEDCMNQRPTLTALQNVCIEAGQLLQVKLTGQDPENHPVKIEVFSPILEGGPETFPATYTPVMTDFASPPVEINFKWQTNCIHVRDQSYQVVFKITDSPALGPKLVTFVTWNIKVIAPKPVWVNIVPDLVQRTAQLEWQSYSCAGAGKIQVWRKVGSSPFNPGICDAGLSIYKGYQLIEELDPSITTYHDTNHGARLSVAAQYCYRLVATFPAPGGGKSYVSSEWCMEPILADAPVITNVTVEKTDAVNGAVKIKWLKPFQISAAQYPEPYEYEVYRGQGFENSDELINVSGRLNDLTALEFVDEVNSRDSIYNYRIVLYSKTQNSNNYNAIDTSSVASTVRLFAESGDKQIRLTWNAVVPWSNVVDLNPWHRIYRGVFGDDDSELELIDSVDVSENGFEYIDTGEFMNSPLQDDVFYSYAIQTRGTYGNPLIPHLLNRSQMASVYPVNSLPPCIPVVEVDKTDCTEFLQTASCTPDDFFNSLRWSIPEEGGCRKDLVSFNIYGLGPGEAEYILLANITGNSFKDEHLVNFAKCYRIEGVDVSGNVSELSDPTCNDNCPAFYLPNIFTPNGDGCNDLFRVSDGRENSENQDCPVTAEASCPQFVANVQIKVMNRWGREVFAYQSDNNHSIYINWNGRDKNGDLLETGTYYYVADVTFDAVDPNQKKRKYKGWVQIRY